MNSRQCRSSTFTTEKISVPVSDLSAGARGWLLDCEIRQHSRRTLEARRSITEKLLWWLADQGHEDCGADEVRGFLAYCTRGHEHEGGRWATSPANGGKFRSPTRAVRPVKARTIQTYHGHLRTFFAWYAQDRCLPASPMANVSPPIARRDQIQPFGDEQLRALLAAADKSPYRFRDRAIVLFLLDTGLRASEVCSLRVRDIDLDGHTFRVRGKGDKERTGCFAGATRHALWMHLRHMQPDPARHIFCAAAGHACKEGLTANGLFRVVRRLGRAAGIAGVRCSPHTFRHTFAVSFLRAGGTPFALKELLGHSSLSISMIYVNLAQADIERQHRQFSPADSLLKKR